MRREKKSKIMARKDTIPLHLKKFLIKKLRRMSIWWTPKTEALNKVKVSLEVGRTLKDKPIMRVFFKCAHCEALFKRDEVDADHINPIVDPVDGMVSWDEYINGLFCDSSGFQILCKPCHKIKTDAENIIRNKVKK
jgi:5-methylcytosine-specific restriction endonuclease McrA